MADAALARNDSPVSKRRPGQRGKDLTGSQVADILRWARQGLSQEQIGAKFEPPKSQSCISACLARLGIDNTAEAKTILKAGAADMALNIVRHGQARDQVQALKGLGVLEDSQMSGLTIQIGGGTSDVQIAVLTQPGGTAHAGAVALNPHLSPPLSHDMHRLSAEKY